MANLLNNLVESSLRSSLFAGAVGGLLVVLRVNDSAVRNMAWRVVVVAMMLMPILSAVSPQIVVRVPSAFGSTAWAQTSAAAPQTEVGNSAAVARSASNAFVSTASAPAVAADPLSNAEPSRRTTTSVSFSASLLLALAYVAGVVVSLVHLFVGWKTMHRLTRQSRPLGDSAVTTETTAAKLDVRESPLVTTPLIGSVFAPIIILPVCWREWSEEMLRLVLAHESAHLRRRDPLAALLSRVNRCLFWFHPLAWWLVRSIGATAEHACDERAIEGLQDARRYADLLINFSRAARTEGGRVNWQAVSMSGGRLDRRVDRVLNYRKRSTANPVKIALAAGTAAALIAASGCRRQAAPAALSPAAEQRQEQLRSELNRINRERQIGFMTAAPVLSVDELREREEAVLRDPGSLDVRRSLLMAYWRFSAPQAVGQPLRQLTPEQSLIRRNQILWLIEHHPESSLAASVEATLSPLATNVPADAEGYEQARQKWLATVENPATPSLVLGNAAYFFEQVDPRLAERLLMRARARDSSLTWTVRLGRLYAITLTGAGTIEGRALSSTATGSDRLRRGDPAATMVRRTLQDSNDPVLLTATGVFLARTTRYARMEFHPDSWAVRCFERALQIDPDALVAHAELFAARERSRWAHDDLFPLSWKDYDAVTQLPESERFEQLPDVAQAAIGGLDNLARWNDPNLDGYLTLGRKRAKQYADEILRLAPRHRDSPRYGMALFVARLTLGSLALADGDKALASRYLLAAAEAPECEELQYRENLAWGWELTLPRDLLKAGERDAVAAFLEKMARMSLVDRKDLLERAAAVRRGEVPKV
jgi:beta-lactamase regulating signal transducer with metallopeptidase domain